MFIKKLLDASMNMVQNMNMLDVTIFKLTIFAAALWIAQLFPVILTVNIWIYVTIWAGWAVYLLSKIDWK